MSARGPLVFSLRPVARAYLARLRSERLWIDLIGNPSPGWLLAVLAMPLSYDETLRICDAVRASPRLESGLPALGEAIQSANALGGSVAVRALVGGDAADVLGALDSLVQEGE